MFEFVMIYVFNFPNYYGIFILLFESP